MRYIAVLGRQPEISIAELSALFSRVTKISNELATFSSDKAPNIDRLGGCMKIATELLETPLEYLQKLPEGKITLGVSDFSDKTNARRAQSEALKLKKILSRHGRSVRVVENKTAILSTATSLHNGLSGSKANKIELFLVNGKWWRVIGVQNIDAYARRDQARPARDAKVGMLPPKLAQVLINLCGDLPAGSRILDPFCGTGVVLQEALLMGYSAYGTDLSERMIEYSNKNLTWLMSTEVPNSSPSSPRPSGPSSRASGANSRQQPPKCAEGKPFETSVGDATQFCWQGAIDAVACECYLGAPMSLPPAEIKLKEQKQECSSIILGFLKNLSSQITSGTPVTIAVPAWLRPDGHYYRMNLVDEIEDMGYNVKNKSREGLLYYREGQVVARDIIILRKK